MSQKKKLTVTASPHTKSPVTVSGIMLDVIIALIPAVFAGIAIFGIRAAAVIFTCVICCSGFEYGFRKLTKRSSAIGDLSAVITGILLAFCLPVSAPLWICIIGSFIAIIMVKQLTGGIGKNPVNPALTARIVLLLAFTRTMTEYTTPARRIADAVSTATPLSYLAPIDLSGDVSAQVSALISQKNLPGLFNMIFGVRAGSIGEVCSVAIILGGVYLILRGVISIAIPGTYLLTTAVITLVASGFSLSYTLYAMLSGGLLLGAFFMATDYTTSPINMKGRIVYGVGCGLLTAILRFLSPYPEGVALAIVLMNLARPLIEKLTMPAYFGKPAKIKAEKACDIPGNVTEEPVKAVEEITETETEETVEEVEEITESEPVETVGEVEEITESEPEKAPGKAPSKPVKLIDDISPVEGETPVKSRLAGFSGRKKNAPAAHSFSKKKAQRDRIKTAMENDLNTPLPDVIPAFLKKDIDKNKDK